MLGKLKSRLASLLRFSPATSAIACACISVFAIQTLARRIGFPPGYSLSKTLDYTFGFYWPLLVSGAFWQPVTFAFLHGSYWHLALNLFTLLFFGASVERILGTRRFTLLFFIASAIGGFAWAFFDMLEPEFWAAVQTFGGRLLDESSSAAGGTARGLYGHFGLFCLRQAQRWGEAQLAGTTYNVCIGASAGVFGLLGAFAGLFPKEKLVILLFFVPLKLQARHVAVLLMAVSLVSVIIDNGHVAHMAHISGGLAGYLYALLIRRRWAPAD